jgi:hypothetical protein
VISDITHNSAEEDKLYLALILDFYHPKTKGRAYLAFAKASFQREN